MAATDRRVRADGRPRPHAALGDPGAARRAAPVLSHGTQEWDYLYIEDVADAIRAVAVNEAAQGILNLSAGEAWSVRALVEEVRDLIDPALQVGFGELADGGASVRGDASRLRELTGWSPTRRAAGRAPDDGRVGA